MPYSMAQTVEICRHKAAIELGLPEGWEGLKEHTQFPYEAIVSIVEARALEMAQAEYVNQKSNQNAKGHNNG